MRPFLALLSAVQCSAVQCSAVQCSVWPYSSGSHQFALSAAGEEKAGSKQEEQAICSAVQCSAVQCSAVQNIRATLAQIGHIDEGAAHFADSQ
jgi:hypothetical protein